jgi:hypothetical protein
MAKEVYDFEEVKCNVSEYKDKIVVIQDFLVDNSGLGATILILDTGEQILTTSGVLQKQLLLLRKKDRLPVRAKIIEVQTGSGLSYYSLAPPK